jgi:histidine triad (HIT) family protein
MDNCIFCKIVKKEIPKEFTYEDEDVLVFPDINPIRPVHLLVIPKEHITELIAAKDPTLFQKLFGVVQKMIQEKGLADKGYRVTINGGGAQIVPHLHIHVIGPMTQTAKMG